MLSKKDVGMLPAVLLRQNTGEFDGATLPLGNFFYSGAHLALYRPFSPGFAPLPEKVLRGKDETYMAKMTSTSIRFLLARRA